MSDLRSRQIEKLRADIVKAHEALCDLIKNEGWRYDWFEIADRRKKSCCLAGAFMLRYPDEPVPVGLSTLAHKCQASTDSAPSLVQLLNSLAMNEDEILRIVNGDKKEFGFQGSEE